MWIRMTAIVVVLYVCMDAIPGTEVGFWSESYFPGPFQDTPYGWLGKSFWRWSPHGGEWSIYGLVRPIDAMVRLLLLIMNLADAQKIIWLITHAGIIHGFMYWLQLRGITNTIALVFASLHVGIGTFALIIEQWFPVYHASVLFAIVFLIAWEHLKNQRFGISALMMAMLFLVILPIAILSPGNVFIVCLLFMFVLLHDIFVGLAKPLIVLDSVRYWLPSLAFGAWWIVPFVIVYFNQTFAPKLSAMRAYNAPLPDSFNLSAAALYQHIPWIEWLLPYGSQHAIVPFAESIRSVSYLSIQLCFFTVLVWSINIILKNRPQYTFAAIVWVFGVLLSKGLGGPFSSLFSALMSASGQFGEIAMRSIDSKAPILTTFGSGMVVAGAIDCKFASADFSRFAPLRTLSIKEIIKASSSDWERIIFTTACIVSTGLWVPFINGGWIVRDSAVVGARMPMFPKIPAAMQDEWWRINEICSDGNRVTLLPSNESYPDVWSFGYEGPRLGELMTECAFTGPGKYGYGYAGDSVNAPVLSLTARDLDAEKHQDSVVGDFVVVRKGFVNGYFGPPAVDGSHLPAYWTDALRRSPGWVLVAEGKWLDVWRSVVGEKISGASDDCRLRKRTIDTSEWGADDGKVGGWRSGVVVFVTSDGCKSQFTMSGWVATSKGWISWGRSFVSELSLISGAELNKMSSDALVFVDTIDILADIFWKLGLVAFSSLTIIIGSRMRRHLG